MPAVWMMHKSINVALLVLITCAWMPSVSGADEVAVHKSSTAKRLLVPPPPPEIPLIGRNGDDSLFSFSILGMPLDYLSKAELENLQKRLETQQDRLKQRIDERDQTLKDQTERVNSFEGLYKEGVVSRKELERAQRDLADMKDHGTDLQNRLQDTQSEIDRVKKQLAAVDKRSALKPASAITHKKKSK